MLEGNDTPLGEEGLGLYGLLGASMAGRVKLSKFTLRMLERDMNKKGRNPFKKKRRKCGNLRMRKRKNDRIGYRRRRPETKIAKVLEYKYTLKGRYVRMKADAKKDGRPWNLSPKDWATLWLKIREVTGREKPWVYNDYVFKRKDTKLPIQLDNLVVHIGVDTQRLTLEL